MAGFNKPKRRAIKGFGSRVFGLLPVFEPDNINGFVKSAEAVIPDLIRNPEVFEITGPRLSPG